jgi:hypothetical protein
MARGRAKVGAPSDRRRPLERYGSLWWYTRVIADLCTVELLYTTVGHTHPTSKLKQDLQFRKCHCLLPILSLVQPARPDQTA